MRKRRVVGRICGMKYIWKGHTDRNRYKNRIKRSGQARLVYVWRKSQHLYHAKVSPRGAYNRIKYILYSRLNNVLRSWNLVQQMNTQADIVSEGITVHSPQNLSRLICALHFLTMVEAEKRRIWTREVSLLDRPNHSLTTTGSVRRFSDHCC